MPSDLLSKPNTSSSRKSSISLLLILWTHVSPSTRQMFAWFLPLLIVASIAEVFSISALIPLLTVFQRINQPYKSQGMTAPSFVMQGFPGDPTIHSAVIFSAVIILAACLRLASLWSIGRISARFGSDLSRMCFNGIIHADYQYHLSTSTAKIITSIDNSITRAIMAFKSSLQVLAATCVSVALIIGLFLISAPVALVCGSLFASLYIVISFTTQRRLLLNSEKISSCTETQLLLMQESLGLIVEIVLGNFRRSYLSKYQAVDQHRRLLESNNVFVSAFPRFILEPAGILLLVSFGAFYSITNTDMLDIIPILGAFALGSQRLLPSMQQAYGGWSDMSGFFSDLDAVYDILISTRSKKCRDIAYLPFDQRVSEQILFQTIELSNLSFSFPGCPQPIIDKLNLTINRGQRIGIIGATGSGKSTLLKIVMALLDPVSGSVLINGRDISNPGNKHLLDGWHQCIGYVPQDPFIINASFAQNIALGVDPPNIDTAKLLKSSSEAHILSFIESRNEGFIAYAGERGSWLSGGQKQRIAIARALYRDCQVLIFDEATSSLDAQTESLVNQSIHDISSDITVIVVAHRLSAVSRCDTVIRLDSGKVVEIGSPGQLGIA